MFAKGLTPILNVSDMEQSYAWFEKLGWRRGWEWGSPPGFGGVCSGECDDIAALQHLGAARHKDLFASAVDRENGCTGEATQVECGERMTDRRAVVA